jgi:hypothetical protein
VEDGIEPPSFYLNHVVEDACHHDDCQLIG